MGGVAFALMGLVPLLATGDPTEQTGLCGRWAFATLSRSLAAWFLAPFGFVLWKDTEPVELHDVDSQTVLDVGIAGGVAHQAEMAVRVQIPGEVREELASFLATRAGNDPTSATDG